MDPAEHNEEMRGNRLRLPTLERDAAKQVCQDPRTLARAVRQAQDWLRREPGPLLISLKLEAQRKAR